MGGYKAKWYKRTKDTRKTWRDNVESPDTLYCRDRKSKTRTLFPQLPDELRSDTSRRVCHITLREDELQHNWTVPPAAASVSKTKDCCYERKKSSRVLIFFITFFFGFFFFYGNKGGQLQTDLLPAFIETDTFARVFNVQPPGILVAFLQVVSVRVLTLQLQTSIVISKKDAQLHCRPF